MERLNPDTGKVFKKGEYRDDGFRFWGYNRSAKYKKTGYFVETWRSPEAYERESLKTLKYMLEKQKRPEMRALMNHYHSKRRCAKLQRTPPWLTKEHKEQIKDKYRKAQALQDFTGIPHDVDHIIPLQGEFVSGLHVPWNLRVVTASENRSKHNKHDIC